jgi:hypothetical protein
VRGYPPGLSPDRPRPCFPDSPRAKSADRPPSLFRDRPPCWRWDAYAFAVAAASRAVLARMNPQSGGGYPGGLRPDLGHNPDSSTESGYVPRWRAGKCRELVLADLVEQGEERFLFPFEPDFENGQKSAVVGGKLDQLGFTSLVLLEEVFGETVDDAQVVGHPL